MVTSTSSSALQLSGSASTIPTCGRIVHACVPESLDRFYQEVGRGGRDGGASISLLLSSFRDFDIAGRLSQRQLLTESRAAHRWEAMFTHKDHDFDEGVHTVPVDCRPGVDDREIDMVGPRNTSWNIRTLVLMAAAGGINLLDVPQWLVRRVNSGFDRENDDVENAATDQERPRVRLSINDSMHRHATFWEGRVADFRTRQKAAAGRSFEQMKVFLRAERCAAEIVAPLYEIADDPTRDMPEVQVGRACGGCPACRRSGRPAQEGVALSTPHPWAPHGVAEPLRRLLSRDGQLLVFCGPRASGALGRRREQAALRLLSKYGVRNLVLLGDAFGAADFADLRNSPLFTAGRLGLNDLPDGPTIVVAGRDHRLPEYLFRERASGGERIWLVDESAPHPSKPGVTLRQAPPFGRVLSLAEFIAELQT